MRIIYPVVDPVAWAKRYRLEIKEAFCQLCGRNIMVDRPFVMDRWRGLMSAPHGCGPEGDIAIAREFDERGRDLWP